MKRRTPLQRPIYVEITKRNAFWANFLSTELLRSCSRTVRPAVRIRLLSVLIVCHAPQCDRGGATGILRHRGGGGGFGWPTKSDGNITRVLRNLAFTQREKASISDHFLFISLCLGQKRQKKKRSTQEPTKNPKAKKSHEKHQRIL